MESDFLFLSRNGSGVSGPLLKWTLILSSSPDMESDVLFLS
jgi:hypothetical protein